MTKVLLALSWGNRYPLPGKSNEYMAKAIQEVANDYDVIITQIEITEALKNLGSSPNYSIGEPGIYIDTYDVVQKAKNFLLEKAVDVSKCSVTVVCHKTHWRGLQLVCKKLGFIKLERLERNIPYDTSSYQWYTRGPMGAFIGKITHGISYFLKGHLI